MDEMEAVCVAEMKCLLGEGALWSPEDNQLYWLDLATPAIFRYDPAAGRAQRLKVPMGARLGGLARRASGGFLLIQEGGVFSFDHQRGQGALIADPLEGRRTLILNDGAVDRQGRLWVGSMVLSGPPDSGALFRVDVRGQVTRVDSGFGCANGPAISPDGRTLYFADSSASRIYAYDLDPASGTLHRRRVFVDLSPDGPFYEGVDIKPDGMCVDSAGGVWSAQWDGWRVVRYTPDGLEDQVIDLPVPRVTSCRFGGPGLSTLFITSARTGLGGEDLADAPLSGSLFAAQTPFRGLIDPGFGG